MRPALSVVFLTTLVGAGQGLFLAAYGAQASGDPERGFVGSAAAGSVALSTLGLVASFFHLGRPERAWRAAAMWRTSWLSREVIALPLFMALVAAWGWAHHAGHAAAPLLGAAALAACLALFVCTAMIYACIRFLQEWASPYTLANFFLMGCASGLTLAAALAAWGSPATAAPLAAAAIACTLAALATRLASLARNARIRPKSSPQTAIGVPHPQVRQVSQGFTGNSFNTIEFFHGATDRRMAATKGAFLALGFVLPVAMLAGGIATRSTALLAAAFVAQYAGFAIERWYFLADAHHPQNLYYQNRA